MARYNIYEGPRSCYARMEGIYVPGKGVNLQTAVSIAYLILRDYRRGWTYDHQCNRIPMDYDLARRRLIYLIALAAKHYGKHEAEKVKEFVREVLITMRIPERYRHLINIVGLEKIKVPVRVPVVARIRRRAF